VTADAGSPTAGLAPEVGAGVVTGDFDDHSDNRSFFRH